ncbi:MAG: rhodanese-like domain-containing protein [Smithella sp.]|nr:rhodanese-like domain-containing protein [Smithella sp.]
MVKKILWIAVCLLLVMPVAFAEDRLSFDNYLNAFDNRERANMKIDVPEMLQLHKKGLAQIIDVRTAQEHREINYAFMKHIPMNELPKRLHELDKSKTIIAVCQFSERAVIARMFLTLRGYNSKYLKTGILGTHQYLKDRKI